MERRIHPMTQQRNETQEKRQDKVTNSKPIPHIPLPFKEVMADVLKVKPPGKKTAPKKPTRD
jgi:hypothetical protein